MRYSPLLISLILTGCGISSLPYDHAKSSNFSLSSPVLTQGHTFANPQLFNSWGCTGMNTSPQLKWTNPPAGTKSFAITLFDPDAPTGSGWWHWIAINIDDAVRSLPTDAGNKNMMNMPKGSHMVINDFGYAGYGGPCPPPNSKPHNYTLTLYALDVEKIDIPKDASGALAGYNILQHVIGKTVLTLPTNAR